MVLDIGSLDINGNNQFLFDTDSLYLGLDIAPGRNVDIVCPAHELGLPEATFDTVISTECLEHDRHWAKSLWNAVRMLRPGGLLLITCATTGRQEHGTSRTTPQDAPLLAVIDDKWANYYRNLGESDIRAAIDVPGLFQLAEFSSGEETHDLYLCAIKHGVLQKRLDRSIDLESHPAKLLVSDLRLQLQRSVEVLHLQKSREQYLFDQLKSTDEELRKVKAHNLTLAERLSLIHSSKSWRSTHPLRVLMTEAGKARVLARRLTNGLGYIARGDFAGFRNRLHSIQLDQSLQNWAVAGPPKEWCIMTTRHTLFIAHLVASRLRAQGWEVDITTSVPRGFPHNMYVVICPQMFKDLPPGPKRIIYQMEQSVSSRWFTSGYLKILENSLAVLEYSLVNVEFMAGKGLAYPHVHYMPVGADKTYSTNMPAPEKTCDVLFYGDTNSSERRRKMLPTLRQHFDVRVCSEIFGSDIIQEIRRARVVINLHYYENALLETPRIQECLSLGVPVVSEATQDQAEYPELSGGVTFFEQGNEQAMIDAVHGALKQPAQPHAVAQSAVRGSERFAFMFDRFLVAMAFLPPSKLMDGVLPLPHDASRIALSMPETITRRRIFEANRPQNCVLFDGLRAVPGWIGCGLSYSSLGRHALKHGIRRLTVLEDDVLLAADFEDKMDTVQTYLNVLDGQWDVFAGLIACIHPDVKVLRVETFRGMRFMIIDKMTSSVCNIYSPSAQRLLASWNPDDRDDQTNTIDKYLERQGGLRVVVALPFLVGHREELNSTLWGFQNTRYRSLIAESEQTLHVMAEAYIQGSSNTVTKLKPNPNISPQS